MSSHPDRLAALRQQILATAGEAGPELAAQLAPVLDDIAALYQGKWPEYQACQVGYHTEHHALDVALTTARMIAGYNKIHTDPMPTDTALAALTAALFHDCGYLKDADDRSPATGGKFTFTHVERSKRIAAAYLERQGRPPAFTGLVTNIIDLTEFHRPPQPAFSSAVETTAACMVASADLLAQMSDPHYLQNIHRLYEEFREAYESEGAEGLAARAITPFASADEMIAQTDTFYERFVLPRLAELGDMGRYLVAYFGEDRNPYLESIAANLAATRERHRGYWRRLGELLTEAGALSDGGLSTALAWQHSMIQGERRPDPCLQKKGYEWIDRQLACLRLGNILLQRRQVDPGALRTALIDQVLPPAVQARAEDLRCLLHILILLQHIENGPWLFRQVLALLCQNLEGRTGTIWLPDGSALTPLFSTDDDPPPPLPRDKGLASWALLHGRPGRLDATALAAPVFSAGEPIAVIEVTERNNGPFDDRHELLLQAAANLIGASLPAALWLNLDCHLPSS